jgi:hypothetical protein
MNCGLIWRVRPGSECRPKGNPHEKNTISNHINSSCRYSVLVCADDNDCIEDGVMSKRDGKMYLALRLQEEGDTNKGLPIKFKNDQVAGICVAFWTKKEARNWYGRKVELQIIQRIPDNNQEDGYE